MENGMHENLDAFISHPNHHLIYVLATTNPICQSAEIGIAYYL